MPFINVSYLTPPHLTQIRVGSPVLMLGAIFGILGLVAPSLYPAGRSLFTFDRVETVDRRLVGLFAIGAIPLVVYGGLELARQLGPVTDHTLFVHYGMMGVAAFFVVLMGALAVLRKCDW